MAEGEVYEFAYCSTYDKSIPSVDNISDLVLEQIDFNELFELEFPELMDFLKENSISKSQARTMCMNTDPEISNFRSIYAGKNCFGLIKKSEIFTDWITEIYGYENAELLYKKGIDIANAYLSYKNSPWYDNESDYLNFQDLILSDKEASLETIKRADISAYRAEEAACGNI